jgi:hypothetical protein
MTDRSVRLIARAAACAVAVGMLPAAAGAADVRIPKTIAFSKTASVNQKIVDQCGLRTLIPEAIANQAQGAQLVDTGANLELEISDVHAPGGWVFSGPKWLEVRGSLRRGSEVISFRAKRYSAFDPFSGGTCGILAKCGRSLGADVAAWLANPQPNAELGDAQ